MCDEETSTEKYLIYDINTSREFHFFNVCKMKFSLTYKIMHKLTDDIIFCEDS